MGVASDAAPVRPSASSEGKQFAPIEKAFVCLNPKMRWPKMRGKIGFDGSLDVYDLRHTFMHEIVHAIGFDHPGRTGSVMGLRYDESIHEPQSSGIASAQRLSGPPVIN